MTRTEASRAVLDIACLAGIVPTPESPACALLTIRMPCSDALTLGASLTCGPGHMVGIVTAAKLVTVDIGPHEPVKPPEWTVEMVEASACAAHEWKSDEPEDRVVVVAVV